MNYYRMLTGIKLHDLLRRSPDNRREEARPIPTWFPLAQSDNSESLSVIKKFYIIFKLSIE